METTVKEIDSIVEWYRELPSDFVGINDLKHKRQQLAGLSDWYATVLGEVCQAMHHAKSNHEHLKMLKRERFAKTVSDSAAERLSRVNTIEEMETYEKASGLYWSMTSRFKSIGNVLDAMKQQLSLLKKEYDEAEAMDAVEKRISILSRKLKEIEDAV